MSGIDTGADTVEAQKPKLDNTALGPSPKELAAGIRDVQKSLSKLLVDFGSEKTGVAGAVPVDIGSEETGVAPAAIAENPDKSRVEGTRIATDEEMVSAPNPDVTVQPERAPELVSLTERDAAILEANKDTLSPFWKKALEAGGRHERNKEGEILNTVFTGGKIGEGGLGQIHRVLLNTQGSNELVAGVAKSALINPMDPEDPASALAQEVLRREGKKAREIQDLLDRYPDEPGAKNLVRTLLVGKENIVYEGIEDKNGRSMNLHEAVHRLPTTSDWLRQFAGGVAGLAFLQRHGINHFDFKPANIVAGKNGEGVLIDYGTALKHDEPYPDVFLTTPVFYSKEVREQQKDSKLPLADTFAVAMSLRRFLFSKGLLSREHTKTENQNTHELLPPADELSPAKQKLYELYKRLSAIRSMDEYQKKTGEISLEKIAADMKSIAAEIELEEKKSQT